MDDVRAVMDAIDIRQAAVIGMSEGGPDVGPVRGHLSRAHAGAHPLRWRGEGGADRRLALGRGHLGGMGRVDGRYRRELGAGGHVLAHRPEHRGATPRSAIGGTG
jgi:hypothetical protein